MLNKVLNLNVKIVVVWIVANRWWQLAIANRNRVDIFGSLTDNLWTETKIDVDARWISFVKRQAY